MNMNINTNNNMDPIDRALVIQLIMRERLQFGLLGVITEDDINTFIAKHTK